ncbi:hypothetical protein GGI07_004789 [Coemansia sp. Benny D115]|nr:hypothetical protein GGI07_004789 [Coemansia sp. Benny D115]
MLARATLTTAAQRSLHHAASSSGSRAAAASVSALRQHRQIHATAAACSVLEKIKKALADARPQAPAAEPSTNTAAAAASPAASPAGVADQQPRAKQGARGPETRRKAAERQQRENKQRRIAARSQAQVQAHAQATGSLLEGADYRPADAELAMPRVFGQIDQPSDARVAKCVLFGAANAGKSTLVNRLTGADVSIVSERPQTTRTRIMASKTVGSRQLVILDTPGVVSRKALRRVARTVVTSSWLTLGEADVVVLLLDAFKLLHKTDEVERYLFAQLRANVTTPAVLVVNKIDAVEDHELLRTRVAEYAERYPHIVGEPLYMSALNNVNVDTLRDLLLDRAEPGDWLVPADVTNDLSDVVRVEELIRAEWFARLSGYLPYIVRQRNVAWQTVDLPLGRAVRGEGLGLGLGHDPSSVPTHRVLSISQELVVDTPGAAKILIGASGEVIDGIRRAANARIVEALGRPVRLHVRVVVEKDTTHRK